LNLRSTARERETGFLIKHKGLKRKAGGKVRPAPTRMENMRAIKSGDQKTPFQTKASPDGFMKDRRARHGKHYLLLTLTAKRGG